MRENDFLPNPRLTVREAQALIWPRTTIDDHRHHNAAIDKLDAAIVSAVGKRRGI